MLPLLSTLAAAALVAGPSSAGAEVECQGVPNCTTVAGPWVQAAPQQYVDQYAATWGGNCPNGYELEGTDWNSPNPFQLDVYVQQISGLPVNGAGLGIMFLAVNQTNTTYTFQPLMGCENLTGQPQQPSAGGKRTRTLTKSLAPNRVKRFKHGCKGKEKLLGSGHAAGFFQVTPPKGKELRDVTVRRKVVKGEIRVKVRTGPRAGDDEKVAIQIHAFCR
jgi:hypothetical protein